MYVFVQSQKQYLETLFISHTQEGQRTFLVHQTGFTPK